MAEVKTVTIDIDVKDQSIKNAKELFDKMNKEIRDQEGLLAKLQKKEESLLALRKKSNDPAAIQRFNKEIEKTRGEMNKLTSTAEKQKSSMDRLTKTIGSMGLALAGTFAIKAVIGDAVNRILDFEKAMSSLSAITGVTGKGLEELKGKVLQVAGDTKKSATEVAKAFELIGSKAPKLLENADALAAVTKQAIILSKASGEDLVQSSGALTGVLNQFNLEATESERIINALAAGSQKGAAPVSDIAAAIDKFGTVANAANISVEQSIALTETLAEKNINGAEAGTQLRNIILKLQSANIGYTDGVFNLNDALQEVKDKNLSAAESAKLFGLESITAGNILVNNIGTIDKYTEAVTGTNTANEQAAIQTDNLRTKTEELDATYESFILSLEDGNGGLSEFSKNIVATATNMLTFITNLNNGKGALASFNELIADQIQSNGQLAEQSKVLGVSQKDLALAYQNNGDVLTVFGEKLKNGEITIEQYRQLVDRLANGVKKEADVTLESTEAIDENTTSNVKSIDSIKKKISALKEEFDITAVGSKRFNELKVEIAAAEKELSKYTGSSKKSAEESKKLAKLREEEAQMIRDIGLDLLKDSAAKEIAIERAKFDDKIKLAKEKYGEETEVVAGLEQQKAVAIQEIVDTGEKKKRDKEALDYEKNLELETARTEKYFEDEAAKFEKQVEFDQWYADAKQQINEQVALGALGLAGAIATAAGSSQEAQITALAIEKLAAIASVIISTIKANAIITAEGASLAIPSFGASVVAAAGLVAANSVAGGLSVATIVATAIPQALAITKPSKTLKDGEIMIQGAGTETSDSIPAMLSKNESVINAKATKKNTTVLKAINDGRFDDWLNNYTAKQLYISKKREIKQMSSAKDTKMVFPKGFYVNNPSAISKPMVEALKEHAFLNQNGKWE